MTRDTITSTFHPHSTGLRVSFSCPDQGYSIDDLDVLAAAIRHAKRKMREAHQASSEVTLPVHGLDSAFLVQQDRMAAPS